MTLQSYLEFTLGPPLPETSIDGKCNDTETTEKKRETYRIVAGL